MNSRISSSVTMSVVAPPAPSQVRQHFVFSPVCLLLIRNFLTGLDIARSRGTSKNFVADKSFSNLQIKRIELHWLATLRAQLTPFCRDFDRWGPSGKTLGEFIFGRMGHFSNFNAAMAESRAIFEAEKGLTVANVPTQDITVSLIIAAENKIVKTKTMARSSEPLTLDVAKTRGISATSVVEIAKRLAPPVSLREMAIAFCTRPFSTCVVAFAGHGIWHACRTYPQLNATVMAMTATWVFIDPDWSRPFHLLPSMKNWVDRGKPNDRNIKDMEVSGGYYMHKYIYRNIEYARFNNARQRVIDALPNVDQTCLIVGMGVLTYLLRYEETIIRPLNPLLSIIWLIPYSVCSAMILGAGIGFSGYYLAYKRDSHFVTSEYHPLIFLNDFSTTPLSSWPRLIATQCVASCHSYFSTLFWNAVGE